MESAKSIKVLYAEDNPDDADLTQTRFASVAPEFCFEIAPTGKQCLEKLKSSHFDVLLLDYRLPDMEGIAVLQSLSQTGTLMPVVMVTGLGDEELVVKTLRLGASDYIAKSGDYLERLPAVLHRAVNQVVRESELVSKSAPGAWRILYVERNAKDAERTLLHFSEAAPHLAVTVSSTCGEALQHLEKDGSHFDLVLADLRLPDLSALDFLQEMKHRGLDIPLVIVAGHGDEETAVAALKLRAYDYVVKRDNYLIQLPYVVDHAIARHRLKRLNAELKTELAERRRVERTLRETEAREAAVLESALDCVVTIDLQGRIVGFNRSAETTFGYPREAVMGKLLVEAIIPPGLRDRHQKGFSRFLTTGQATMLGRRIEITGMRSDGTEFPLELTITAVSGPGAPSFTAFLRDISERKRSEEALRASEERFRQLAENIREVFWMTDPEKNRMIYVSPGYEMIWGRTCQSLYDCPRSWIDAIHPDERTRVLEAALSKQDQGEYNVTYRIARPDGTIRWIRDRAFPIRDAGGKVFRIAGIAEDITEWRNMEDRLRQSQKMDSIGRLAGGVAHDFNNILTIIQGHASLLSLDGTLSAELAESAREITKAADRAAGLTGQLLAFGRQQLLQPRALDINAVIDDIRKMLHQVLGERISLEIQSAGSLPNVSADAAMIEQVLLNLAMNARDAMPDGGRFMISTSSEVIAPSYLREHAEALAGKFVCMFVKDTGRGIAPENLPKLFEPFFTTKEIGKGTGLGLATVYGIVHQHHGWIRVESTVGEGTVFRVYLPVLPEPSRTSLETGVQIQAARGTETILVLEEDSAVRHLMVNILERCGYRVLEASSRSDAMSQNEKNPGQIELIITDLVLSDGTEGRELVKELQSKRTGLKVIYASSHGSEIFGQGAEPLGEANLLSKPYRPGDLMQAVRLCLDEKGKVKN